MSVLPAHPPLWSLADLVGDLVSDPAALAALGERAVSALALDSREVVPGALFLACRGSARHGLEFAEEARRRGALAILAEPAPQWSSAAMAALGARLGLEVLAVEALGARASALAARFHGNPSQALEVFGVTGTNGKSSVTHFLAQALAPECRCAIIGTLGNGFPGALRPSRHTTPDALSLQATLAELRAEGARALAMEVSSHALDQERVGAVSFSHAIFTNLSRDHLDYHGDMAAYGAAKRRLFARPELGWAVINLDDPFAPELIEALAPGVALAGYGLDPPPELLRRARCWVSAPAIEQGPTGLDLVVDARTEQGVERARLRSALLGRFNALNLLAVLGVQLTRGLSLERAVRTLERVRAVPGRMEAFGGEGAPRVVVDYAHSPDALEQVLASLREHVSGRLITVFGCGGERDRGKRPLMGAIAERHSDLVILTDDNPRRESPEAIVSDVLAGLARPERVRVERSRALAIRLAMTLAGLDDLVLVAGKGHETTQDMGECKVHFSDRAQVVEALREWREGHH
ncbi:MAG: UDP-N-acetylmuramoyl-L-alanyl-D-glutamate--2,6-diaminopimelate ligase [Chromatiaceae bacterium]|nr:UDP-N-acetylmuramoyl-L-alanyl-D-glutamate--2,6-diaminopimelate ligase [Chromatiaceae bacterium]